MPSKPVLVRISTVPHSLHLLLKGQMKFMADNGFEVVMICANGPEVPELIEREGCEWIEVPLTREFGVLKDLKALFYLVRVFWRLKPDIVHSHSPKAGTVGQLAAWIRRVPVRIHTVAGLPLLEFSGKKRKLLDFVEKLTYRCVHWVLPNSSVQAKYLLDNKYLPSAKLRTIGAGSSNGIDLRYFSHTEAVQRKAALIKEQWQIADSDFTMCFVGRLTNYKGVSELVKAYLSLKDHISALKLVLVGPFEELNPLSPEIHDAITTDPSIFTTGHVADVRPYLSLSDIFVFPSYREGFPQSLMQACAMGLPCVATDINGCNEIVEHGKNGLLIKPKSAEAIKEAVEKLYRDTPLRVKMAHEAAESMRQGFDQQEFWHELLNFYKTELYERKNTTDRVFGLFGRKHP